MYWLYLLMMMVMMMMQLIRVTDMALMLCCVVFETLDGIQTVDGSS